MAVRRQTRGQPKVKMAEMPMGELVPTDKTAETKAPSGKWLTLGWILLLLGGLAHMLPEQMMPLLKYAMYGVTVQMVVGALSVIVALYYLMGE